MKPDLKVISLFALLGFVSIFSVAQTSEPPVTAPPPSPVTNASAPPATPSAGLGIGFGFVSMQSGFSNNYIGWQKIGIVPDIPIGKFGIGFDLNIYFRFNGGSNGQTFEVRPDDWVVTSFQNFLEVYLPKIQYIRYGIKGDPVYLLLGSIYDGHLGNGFIVNGYTNTLYQPSQRIFGGNFDLDGAAFDFPYIGFETMLANFAALDLMAGRFYIRPGAKSDLPALAGMQIGATFVTDTNPHYYSPDPAVKANPTGDTVFAWGVDIMQPIIAGTDFTMNFLGDMAFEKTQVGGQIGFGGTIITVLNYLAAVRYLGDNFIPDYFDSSYDIMREERFAVYRATSIVSPAYAGWLFNLGFAFFNNALAFNFTMDGPFVVDQSVPTKNPNMKITLGLKEGILAGFSLQGVFEKHEIRTFADLVDPTNALISFMAGYKMGPAKISLIYDIRYDPYQKVAGDPQPWKTNSRIETTFDLF